MEILAKRQERLEQERIKKELMTNGIENSMMFDDQQPNTSRLVPPTKLEAPEESNELKPEPASQSRIRQNRPNSGMVQRQPDKTVTSKPKINKNTEALLQNRNQRLQAQEEARQ